MPSFSMLDLAAEMGQDKFDSFMRGLVRGKYHALLGAGASIGGFDSNGKALPGGLALAKELASEFGIDASSTTNLRRIYKAAEGKTSSAGATRAEYMASRFIGNIPPAWMELFVRLSWSWIWTLNIDDCLERSYEQNRTSRLQTPLSISWTEKHRSPRNALDEVLLIHLHGKANRVNRSNEELVFDISSYLHSMQGGHRWHALFGDYYPSEPFVVLGASLDDEIDLQAILEQGHLRSADHPSLIVNKDMSPLSVEEYKRYGLVPISATIEDFFLAIESAQKEYVMEVSATENEISQISPNAIAFLNQWQALESVAPAHRDIRHDIYAGHEPEWTDVLDELVVNRGLVSPIATELSGQVPSGESRVVLISGGMFSGKTATVLAIAEVLLKRGFQPYTLTSLNAPDVEAIAWWLKHYPKSVLILDNAHDFAVDAVRIVDAARNAAVPARLLLAEREGRTKGLERELAAVQFSRKRLSDTLSDSEISGFVQKLTQKSRLGELSGRSNSAKISYFVSHGRQLFAAMEGLEQGRGFEARVKDEYAAIESADGRQLVGVTALSSYLGYGLPLALVPRASGLGLKEVEDQTRDGVLADLLHINGRTIQPRHRVFGQLLVESCLTVEEKYQLAIDLASAVAPHVSIASISQRSAAYRIARSLMGHNTLHRLFGQDDSFVLKWYEVTEEYFDWNARFWEQRALAASGAGRHEPAFSWAMRAVTEHRDAFSLNTVGTVLMRRALAEATQTHWPSEGWESAESFLREARSLEGELSEYPYDTFFQYTLKLAEIVLTRDEALNNQLQQTWNQWHASCLLLDPVSKKRIQPILNEVQPKWNKATGQG